MHPPMANSSQKVSDRYQDDVEEQQQVQVEVSEPGYMIQEM